MAIALGGNQINKAYLGGTEIQKMYLGDTLVFDSTVIVDTLHPILYNFRLEDNTTRIYFDSSKIITGSTYNGFTISNKTINGISINAGQTTGHYLTVTSGFNFWDNMTIRYDGSNNIVDGNSLPVYPFNLQDVDNQIPQPIGSGNIYYVTTSGNDGNDGESEGQAWRTLAYADGQLGAGDTLYVKAGNYGDDKMYFKNSSGGTIDEPILISGYQTTPGDITSNYYDYGVSMSSSEMPMVVGGTAVTRGVELTATDYFIIENMQWSGYRYGIYMDNSSTAANNMTFNRCNFTLQGDGDTDGYGFYSTGINNTKITLNDCRFFDASHSNCVIMGNNNAIYDTKAYAERTDSNGDLTLETDYHYVISGQFNKAVRSHAEHVANIEHSGHGFSLKNQYYTIDSSYKVEYCLIDDCTVTNVNGALELRHNSVKYNHVNNLVIDGSPGGGRGNGLVIRDGASYNTIDSCTVRNINTNDDWTGFLYFKNSSEDGTSGITMTDNVIQNCLFHTGATGEYAIVWGRNAGSEYAFTASGTKFYNNTFKGIPNLQYKATLTTVTGTVWENNIFDTVSSLGTDTGGSWDYNLFYNGFSTQGTNPITVNPDLDANYQPQATFTDIDVPKISGINYGKNGNERQDDTTVGSILSAEEVPSQPPVEEYDFYVSADGTGDGLTEGSPMSFADSQTAINSMTSGQSIAYKGGDEFFGQLTLTSKTGITLTSYDGKAIITGAEPIVGWSDQGGNVWAKDVTGKVINNVFKDGISANNTRMPLPDMYTIGEGSSNTTIICPEIAGISYPDIVGATVYAEQNQWTVNNRPVTAFDPITGTITVSGTESMTIGTGFTIHNSKNLLAAQDDWAYDQGANTLYVYSVGEPTGITATTIIDKGIYLDGCDNITIDNLDVNGFGTVGIALSNTNTTTISNSKVHDCTNRCISENSIYDAGNYDIIVSDCELYNTNDHAIRIYGKVTMEDNIIHDVSMLENRTWTGTSPMTGISVSGDNSVIQRNTMYNFGYNAISFGGQGLLIQNNFIEDHNIYYPDGGGIYTYSEDWTDTSGDNSQILSNTIINYQPRFREAITCIYLDDRSKLITVDENTTQGARRGIYLHNTRDTVITNNTIHDSSQYGITLSEDSNGGEGNMYGNTITGNTILIEESNFGTAPMSCGSQYSSSDFGTLNSNIYYSMGNYSKANVQNTVDFTHNDQFPQENSLSQWQSKYGDDALTTTNTDYYDTFTPENIGSDLIGNGDFTGGVSGWSADNGSVSDGGGFLIGTPSATGCKVKSDSNFAIVIGETYMVQFDVKSNAEQRFKTFINMITGPYYALNLSSILADTSWKTYKYYFVTEHTSTNVRLDFYTQSMNEIHLDNVSINKIDLGTPPQNSFLAYNETSVAKDVTLPTGTWDSIDGTLTNATGTINVSAYSSLIMIKQ